MEHFTLNSWILFMLTTAGFLTGVLKSTLGRHPFYLFGIMEFICCTTIAVSIAVQISKLSYKVSKLLFILAILVDYETLFLDMFMALDCIERSEKNEEKDRSGRRWLGIIRIDLIPFLKDLVSALLCFSPLVIVTFITLVHRTHLDIFKKGKEYFMVIDVIENGKLSGPSYLCITGLGMALIGLTAIFLLLICNPRFDDGLIITSLMLSAYTGMILIPYAALRASEATLPSYLFITVTTITPFLSLIFTFVKSTTLESSQQFNP